MVRVCTDPTCALLTATPLISKSLLRLAQISKATHCSQSFFDLSQPGTPVRRGLGLTKNQFRALQRLKLSEERKFFSETLEFVPDHHDSGILTRRGFDALLRKAWKPPSDKQYTAMCQAIWKHNPLGTAASEQEFIAELQENGFSWDQILHLQECHDWDNHNWRTGKAEMFLPTTETMYNSIQATLADEKEYARREAVVKYLDKDGNNELQLAELQELVELSGEDGAALDEITYRHMIREAGGDESREVLTVDDFDRLLTYFQELGWVPSSTDMYNALVDQGKLDACVQYLGKFDSELNPHDAVMGWIDGDQNGRLHREELNKLLATCRSRITDDEWQLMCDAGEADPKIGFNEDQFLRLQHATFSFSHSWLPSSTELYGAIMELHGEVALHPDPDALHRDYAQSHLQEAMTGRPFGGSISRVMLEKVFQHLGRSPLTDDEYEQLFEKVGCWKTESLWLLACLGGLCVVLIVRTIVLGLCGLLRRWAKIRIKTCGSTSPKTSTIWRTEITSMSGCPSDWSTARS